MKIASHLSFVQTESIGLLCILLFHPIIFMDIRPACQCCRRLSSRFDSTRGLDPLRTALCLLEEVAFPSELCRYFVHIIRLFCANLCLALNFEKALV